MAMPTLGIPLAERIDPSQRGGRREAGPGMTSGLVAGGGQGLASTGPALGEGGAGGRWK